MLLVSTNRAIPTASERGASDKCMASRFFYYGIVQLCNLLYQALGIYLPLITTNCAVLGSAALNFNAQRSVPDATIFGCFSGVGFAIALLLFASLRERLELASPPKAFEGIPIGLVTAGILAMAFVGFAGLC